MSDMPPPPPTPDDAVPPPTPSVPPLPATAPPPPPVATPAAPPAVAEPATGPLGRSRSAVVVILLTIVTLGIWAVVWSFQNGKELKEHARSGIGGVGYLFITLLISPVTMFLMASEVEQLYRRRGLQPPITTLAGLWFLLPLIGNLIWYVKIQSALNDYWTRVAASPTPA